MISRRHAIASLALGPFSVAGSQAVGQNNSLVRFEQMPSAFIEPRTIHVWLPPAYFTSRRRFPVIYMHDGQNVFTPAYAFRRQAWEVDDALSAGGLSGRKNGAIVVGIWNTPQRRSDYAPTAIEAYLPLPLRDRIARENGHPSAGDAYLRFIVEELKPLIDRNFRTQTSPHMTSIMGSSRGGMISLYALCEYPHIFGNAACLSTHWLMLSAPSPTTDPNLETPAICAAIESYLRAKLPSEATHRIWMDHGTINLDSYYAPYQQRVDASFNDLGWIKGRDYESRIYQGADHNEAAWRNRLADPLDFILGIRRQL